MDEIDRLRDGQTRLTEALHTLAVQQAVTANSVETTSDNVDQLTQILDRLPGVFSAQFAPKNRFELVEKVVLGAAGLALLAVVSGALAYVIKTPSPFGP